MQEPVHRLVALKMIRAGEDATEEDLARFRTEGEAVARLRHPNVIQLYEFGEHGGQPYFSMEFAAGGSLGRRLGGGPLAVREAAELVRTLALATHAAHQEHIVHRDLKPANVLLMDDGTPRISDFGLAKLLDTDSGQTRSNAVLGTPAYMAPEQAAGRVRDTGPAVDVWALGVILYECLTGRGPFRGDDKEDTLERVRAREPERPSRLRPGLSPDLEAVCLKCLEKKPGDRYPTAAALADDLGRWLEGRAVWARPRRWYERAWRRARARPYLGVAAAVVLVAAVAAPFVADRLDPEYPRKRVERLLARGKPFVIEGHEGFPGPFRSVLGDAGLPKPNAQERCGMVETLGFGLVELVRDPGCENYRFLVEMRHDDGIVSRVGLYFGYRDDLVGGIRQGSYYTFTFADKGPGARAERDADDNPVSRVVLQGHSFVEDGQHPYPPHGAVGRGKTFHPINPEGLPGPWRVLVLEVRPEGVQAWWALENAPLESVEKASAREMKDCLEAQKRICRLPAEIPTDFRPRSGLGLYVFNGRVSVRRIVLEPLTDG
jgi:serine/threonine-protein kinase